MRQGNDNRSPVLSIKVSVPDTSAFSDENPPVRRAPPRETSDSLAMIWSVLVSNTTERQLLRRVQNIRNAYKFLHYKAAFKRG